jgi:hypothetical protein
MLVVLAYEEQQWDDELLEGRWAPIAFGAR